LDVSCTWWGGDGIRSCYGCYNPLVLLVRELSISGRLKRGPGSQADYTMYSPIGPNYLHLRYNATPHHQGFLSVLCYFGSNHYISLHARFKDLPCLYFIGLHSTVAPLKVLKVSSPEVRHQSCYQLIMPCTYMHSWI
jgi:hypothetical protein